MYFWYGDPERTTRAYGAELGFYELNKNQIQKYLIDGQIDLKFLNESLHDDTWFEDDEIEDGSLPSINQIHSLSDYISQGPYLEENYGIAICNDIDNVKPKLISDCDLDTFEMPEDFNLFFPPGSFSIAWIRGLKWGAAFVSDESINENSEFKLQYDAFNGKKIITGLTVDGDCIEEFIESWQEAIESISGTDIYLVEGTEKGYIVKEI